MRSALAVFFASVSFALPAGAQGSAPERKDPHIAKMNAFYYPGGGQFYTGEKGRAFALLGVSAVSAYKAFDEATCQAINASFVDTSCSKAALLLWTVGAVGPYIYGIMDAPNSAARANASAGLRAVASHTIIGIDARGRTKAGFSFSFYGNEQVR